jgi:hypothetical protein
MSVWKVTVRRAESEASEWFDKDSLLNGLGALDWDTVTQITIEPSTEDAKAAHLRNSLLTVTLTKDVDIVDI